MKFLSSFILLIDLFSNNDLIVSNEMIVVIFCLQSHSDVSVVTFRMIFMALLSLNPSHWS